MKKYEEETGKKAIWRETITEGFKKWQRGEKIYPKEGERINIIVSKEKKEEWQKFADTNSIATISELLRKAVDFYISSNSKISRFNNFGEITHNLKEKLNAIKGFSQILIKENKNDLSWDILLKIKEILDKSIDIENIINNFLAIETEPVPQIYDVIIIEDDDSTYEILREYFEHQGYSCHNFKMGTQAVDFIVKNPPKVILLDILLPDMSGFDACKQLRSNKELNKVPIFYTTAVPEHEIQEKLKETKADGYFLKPFNIDEFDKIIDLLP